MEPLPIYTVVVCKIACNELTGLDEEDVTRFYFASPDAILRNLPGILYRFNEIIEALDDGQPKGMTVDAVVAYLAKRENMTAPLHFTDELSIVCAWEVLHR